MDIVNIREKLDSVFVRYFVSAKEMQVCLSKIFLVEHQILHNMRQNRETIIQILERNIVNPRVLYVLCPLNNADSAYEKSNIKSNRSDIR